MADIGKKIKGAATKAAKDKVSGEKKGKGTRGSKSGVEKAERATVRPAASRGESAPLRQSTPTAGS
jgi:hypothetical protein